MAKKTTKQQHKPYVALKNAISGKGLNLKEVADALHITEGTLSQKLNGGSDFYLSEMRTICDTFGIDKAVFFDLVVA